MWFWKEVVDNITLTPESFKILHPEIIHKTGQAIHKYETSQRNVSLWCTHILLMYFSCMDDLQISLSETCIDCTNDKMIFTIIHHPWRDFCWIILQKKRGLKIHHSSFSLSKNIVPTIGASAVVMALQLCDQVSLAGFGYDMRHPEARLHYYEAARMDTMNAQVSLAWWLKQCQGGLRAPYFDFRDFSLSFFPFSPSSSRWCMIYQLKNVSWRTWWLQE